MFLENAIAQSDVATKSDRGQTLDGSQSRLKDAMPSWVICNLFNTERLTVNAELRAFFNPAAVSCDDVLAILDIESDLITVEPNHRVTSLQSSVLCQSVRPSSNAICKCVGVAPTTVPFRLKIVVLTRVGC